MKNNLRKIRESQGLTQVELGKLSGINPTTISHYENRAEPKMENRLKLARALKCGVLDIWPDLLG